MTMVRRHVVAAVARRDITVASRSAGVMVPMIAVPVVFCVLLPTAVAVIARTGSEALPLDGLTDLVPSSIASSSGSPQVQAALMLATYVFPTLLMVVPLMVVSVVSTDSVAGERERGSLEGLLLTPITDTELFVGKMLSSGVPAAAVHLFTSILYGVAVSVALRGPLEGLALPSGAWLLVVLWVAPAFTAAALGASIIVSARSRTVQGAQQVTGVAVLPLLLLVVGQLGGVALLSGWLVAAVGLALWVAAALTIVGGSRVMSRPRLSASLG